MCDSFCTLEYILTWMFVWRTLLCINANRIQFWRCTNYAPRNRPWVSCNTEPQINLVSKDFLNCTLHSECEGEHTFQQNWSSLIFHEGTDKLINLIFRRDKDKLIKSDLPQRYFKVHVHASLRYRVNKVSKLQEVRTLATPRHWHSLDARWQQRA